MRVRSVVVAGLMLPLTLLAGCESDDETAPKLVEESCEVAYAPLPGVTPEMGMHDPDPEELKLELDQVKRAAEKAMEAATLDDKWFEFSVAMSALYERERAYLQRVEAGNPHVPAGFMRHQVLNVVDATCDEALGRDD